MENNSLINKDINGNVTFGNMKTRIIIEAEESLNEKAFKVSKIRKEVLGFKTNGED